MSAPDDEWFDATADAILIIDAGGVIRRASASCAAVLGYRPDELVGEPVELLVPASVDSHQALRQRFHRAPGRRTMGNGARLSALHKDGREIPVDIALSPCRLDGGAGVVAAVRDMSERHALENRLRLQSLALEAAANGVVITDRAGTITWCNPAFSRMTGYGRDEILGQHTRMLKSGAHEPSFYRALWETVLAGDTWSGEIVNRRRDGTLYHEEQMITPVTDERDHITHFIAIKQDVTERHRAEQALHEAHRELAARVAEIEALNHQLHDLAIRDPLTGLFNRRYFEASIHREHQRLRREKQPLSLVMIDIDHFKLINDDYGHAVGDRVLQAIAEHLRSAVRSSDLPCRFGGEEFLIALPGAGAEIAAERADRWRRQLADGAISSEHGALRVTFSAGVAELRGDDDTVDAALARADVALYAAKRGGRNRVEVAPARSTTG